MDGKSLISSTSTRQRMRGTSSLSTPHASARDQSDELGAAPRMGAASAAAPEARSRGKTPLHRARANRDARGCVATRRGTILPYSTLMSAVVFLYSDVPRVDFVTHERPGAEIALRMISEARAELPHKVFGAHQWRGPAGSPVSVLQWMGFRALARGLGCRCSRITSPPSP